MEYKIKISLAESAVKDLEEINNKSLAMEFGIELYRKKATSTNWEELKNYLESMKSQMFGNTRNNFTKH